jgi:hypothetical protein
MDPKRFAVKALLAIVQATENQIMEIEYSAKDTDLTTALKSIRLVSRALVSFLDRER